ncbi:MULTISPECIES: hypothetical protein [unclassified Paenibacillus]|uniref:hypothetical protein n=1 Tax=unclassified Paenibacillus TaxID=185978 RepID=UPI001AE3252D|nr:MULTISPECIES: hypothetical protein [unclassified Paenibacillus]MBP1157336.1 hypothetical protein [Paenibacillus sp. PvP091]MBP1171926.1 hypothetical protein [Paenibacillus sp. PvR098]MBP2438307.1 hypothetical protein [Paenibacillus sp. PvP052]
MEKIGSHIKGKRVIGIGARRIVYDLGNGNVKKVAKSKYGIKSNKREVITYRSSSPSVRKHLANIIDFENGYKWIIMTRFNRDLPKSKEYRKKLYGLRAKFRKNGIIPYEILTRQGRPNYQNVRLKQDGEIVVIDYGNFRFRGIKV